MGKCAICGKGNHVGMKVSHSHVRNKKTWEPNLQHVKTVVDGKPTRLYVCTRCLKAGKVKRAL
ncbi:MAG: 50S ribosomal protein L28 [Syntrophaceticus sp.]|jgi:large subunit ribosomal protein L28|nr:50S ribosomal protein L28 [Syntrophaceticus sp.]HBG22618.1 50S ribosomal protein L28 [Peptococcaceae bacterium]MDD3314069.1 50S ribosomal protein L28 [Syntrophaceticus sp.]MDD4359564.1 50S ribosomal protein L28 [Syntrophaceticus sp.]MDD4783450.1 50S ribosomal protein L28 [Syntrophaceticus sp.]